MKNLIIVGAGGFAKEILGYIYDDILKGYLSDIKIKGILVDYLEDFNKLNEPLRYLGKIRAYNIKENDIFLIAIGENPGRNMIIDYFERLNAKFFSYSHSSCYIHRNAKIEEGLIMAPFCIINAEVILGKHAFLNSYSAIGHNCCIGSRAILYPYATINGGCVIGKNLVMGTKATIFPKITLGDNCTITSHSYVKSNKSNNRFIHQKTKEIDLENRM